MGFVVTFALVGTLVALLVWSGLSSLCKKIGDAAGCGRGFKGYPKS